MDTTHGEPDWVNWSKETWAIEELMQDAIALGDSISATANWLSENLDLREETWAKLYGILEQLEKLDHELLAVKSHVRHIGIVKD